MNKNINIFVEIIIITKLHLFSTIIKTNFYYFPDFSLSFFVDFLVIYNEKQECVV